MLTQIQETLLAELRQTTGIEFKVGITEVSLFYSRTTLKTPVKGLCGSYCVLVKSDERVINWIPENNKTSATTTLFHELAHATNRFLGRKKSNERETKAETAFEEMVAEVTAFHLTKYFMLDTIQSTFNSLNYISEWDVYLLPDENLKVHREADKAMKYILSNWLPDFNEKFIMSQKKAV